MRINEQIRIPQLRLFDDTTDEALGIVSIEEARQLAVERGLDLVEVAATAQPPVCRLMDYGRFKFEALKREKDSRRDHNVVQLKEQKLRPKISDHDFMTKLAKVKQFLGEGDKVKLTIMFRGREMVHQEFGRKLLDRMTTELRDLAVIERSPLVEGRNMIMILSPTVKKPARVEHGHEQGDRHRSRDEDTGSNGRTVTAEVTVTVPVLSDDHVDAPAGATTPTAAPEPAPAAEHQAATPAATSPVDESSAVAGTARPARAKSVSPRVAKAATAKPGGATTATPPAKKTPVQRRPADAQDSDA